MTADNLTGHADVDSPVIGAIETMNQSQCLNVIIHSARMKAFYEAQIVKALARYSDLRPPPGGSGKELDHDGRQLISAELAVSPRAADIQVRQSRKLVDSLPSTLSALEKGDIDQRRALAMVDLAGRLSKEDASRVERVVLEGGARPNYRRFRDSVRQQVIKVDADAVARRKAARQNPDVSVEPCDDGMCKLIVDMNEDEAILARKRIDTLAEEAKIPGDTRTDGQRRVAVVYDVFVRDNRGEGLSIKVAMDDAVSPTGQSNETERLGDPIACETSSTPEHRADVATSLDPSEPPGHVLDIAHHRYVRPPQLERANECETVGCRAPAETGRIVGSDDSKAVSRDEHCTYHKVKKQHHGWTFNYPAPGVIALTSPDGGMTHTYAVAPAQYLDAPA
ncbi:13E12 repeat family protein [Kibdelosporangium philippinense]|uniref:13E12 repeat family protein n=2 Tax=Kibdelosporangium philippinense TaxID=211113 RepID=A0ABS8ZTK9_9PSEU|nr:DUF222 domain-containing protein [Kibdelosporangium philippinense]MCE7010573.1 13E12 repeat family protein [Kibdelosporangium philippinense]